MKLADMIDPYAPAKGPPPRTLWRFFGWALRGSYPVVVAGARCDLSRLAPHKRAVFEVLTLPRVYTLRGVRCE